MKCVGLIVVRNEGDILAETLRAAWALLDALLVVDCGSDDNSIDVIRAVAEENRGIIFAGQLRDRHPDEVRSQLWIAARRFLRASDWWVIIDADEFLEDGFSEKVRRAAAGGADHLFSAHANFYYTETERQDWLAGRETMADRERPIAERRRRYRMHTSMPRLFRNLPWLRWHPENYLPRRLARAGTEQVIYRHYQYRDLPQIERRVMTRQSLSFTPEFLAANPHWLLKTSSAAISSDDDPTLRLWTPGESFEPDAELPKVPQSSLVKSLTKYVLAICEARRPNPAPAPIFDDGAIARLPTILKDERRA